MSPTPESASSNPRKPDRKSSSSALLTAFKNLTTGRSASAAQVPPLPTLPTPRSNAAPNNHADADGSLDASAVDSRVDGLDRAVSEPDKIADPAPGNGDLHGALDELNSLLPSLGAERPLSGRLRGASDVASFLNKYPVKDVLPIWVAGSDLLRKSNPDDAIRAGFVLLVSCIKASKSLVEKNLFWESLVNYEGSNNVDLRLQALIEVTDHGRTVESFESGLPEYMARLLKDAFNGATKARNTNQRNRGGPAEEQTLEKTFHFAVDVVRFNPVDLKDEGYKVIIDQVKCICQKTISKVDIANGLIVMGAVVTYTSIPFATFRPCFELLCQIYKQLESQREQTWTVVKRVLRSHLRIDAIDHLLLILSSKDDGQPAFHPNTIHGAFFILRDLTENDGANDLPNVTLTTFSPAVNNALRRTQDAGLRTDVLKFYKFVFGSPALKVHMIDNVDWTYFIGSLEQCSTTCKSLPSDDAKTTPLPSDTVEAEAGSVFNDLIDGLCREFPSLSIIHQEETVRLLFKLENHLSDYSANALVEYISSQPILSTIAGNDYRSIWKHLTGYFAHETSRPQAIRRRTYSYLVETFDALQYLSEEEDVVAFADLLLEGFATEEDPGCLDTLAIFVGKALTSTHRDSLFDSIMLKVRQSVFHRATRNSSPYSSGRSQASTPVTLEKGSQPSLCRIVVRHIIRLFLTTLNHSAQCAETLYHFILDVARSSTCDADARICALKLLFRLRCTSDYRIYVVSVSESESIAAVLCRTQDTAVQANWIDVGEQSKESRSTSGNHPRTRSVRLSKPVPPLWFYPGPKGLPQEPFETPSLIAYAANPEQSPRDTKTAVLPLTLWLETVLSLLQETDVDWEIYSYVLVHLGAQLKNRTLFTSAVPHIKLLRSVICDQIRSQSFHDPPSHTLLRKADVAVCLFHVLTMLIGYSAWFAKSEDDEIVRSFILGIGSWDGTSKWCIHALSVCCHEVPLSVSKSLDGIIQKMSQIITQPQIAIHILEFLCCLSRLPHVYSNFREDEYKMVFGVSFRYLQSVRDRKQRDEDRLAPPIKSNKRHSDSIREVKLSAEPDLRGSGPSDDLPEYVYALAFHVITFWFMALKLRDRPAYVPWIARNLMYQDRGGKEVIEDQGMVTLDMMERIAYTDRDETIHNAAFAQPTDGEVAQCTWITGLSLLTIETAGRTGLSQLTIRRPSGTKYSIYRPSLAPPPRHQVPLATGLDADAFYASTYTGVLPEDVLQDLYSPLALASIPGSLPETPLLLPDDDMVQRDLSTFDRNSTVDGYRIGVIYIGEGQTSEVEILANTNGSAAYAEFISQLGTLVRLKGATMNTQDLDRVADVDGPYAYCWRDRSTEVVFHITTMMPTDLENDAQCINKKRHIGNDFVNIVWNESGQDFRFDTFPSAFNYVYIVITPETRASPVLDEASAPICCAQDASSHTNEAVEEAQPGGPPTQDALFRVQVLSAASFPALSPASEAKLLSGRALGPFVRLVALNGAFFSRVWEVRERGGEHVSSWRNRLLDIRRMRDKYGSREKVVGGAAPADKGGGGSNRTSGAWGGGGDRSSMNLTAARQQRASLSFGLSGAEPGYF